MAKNRYVNTKFWTDRFVFQKWNFKQKYIFLYLLTNDCTNIAGVYELSPVKASMECGIDLEEFEQIIESLKPKVYYIEEYVYIPKFLDHQGVNPKIELGVSSVLKSVPERVKKAINSIGIESDRLLKAIDRVSYNSNINSNSNFNSNNKTKTAEPQTEKPEVLANIQRVYDFYVEKFSKNPNQFKLSPQRKAKIKARLKDAGGAMLIKAIENTSNSPFHMGDNDRTWKADLDWILKSYEQVERMSNIDKESAEVEFSIYDEKPGSERKEDESWRSNPKK